MVYKGIDCATRLNTTSAKGLKDAGITHVGRYLGHSWKGLTLEEVNDISSVGLKIFSIFEMSPTRTSYFTKTQGIKDAQDAVNYVKELYQPEGTAIYFTVDYGGGNNDLPEIEEYFKAIKDNLKGYKVGGYGSFKVVSDLKNKGLIDYVFQTYAWSSHAEFKDNDIYQHLNGQKVAEIQVDLDEIASDGDVGAWSLVIEQDSDITHTQPHTLKKGDKGDAVKALQEMLIKAGEALPKFGCDSDFGNETEIAVKSFQSKNGLIVDGIAGEKTFAKLNEVLNPPKKEVEPVNNTLNDIKGHWAEKEINEWITRGIMKGHSDGNFAPDESLTRAQLCVVLSCLKENGYLNDPLK